MWQPLATIDVTDQWQYTPATTGSYIRFQSLGNIELGRGYFAQSWENNPSEIELFEITKIHPAPEATIVKLDSVFAGSYGAKKIAVRRSRSLNFNWQLQIDHIPNSQPDLLAFKDTAKLSSASVVNSSAIPVILTGYFPERKGLLIRNNSSQILYLKFGDFQKLSNGQYPAQSALITDSHIRLAANTQADFGFKWSESIFGFWASVNGSATITNLY